MQGAAVSVCQFLASEVHKPSTAEPIPPVEATKKEKVTVKKPSAAKPVKPRPAEPPAPPPIVTTIMEMGFSRKKIEYAVKVC